MKEKSLVFMLLLFLALPLSFASAADKGGALACEDLSYNTVWEYCDEFVNPYGDCEIDIDNEYDAQGYAIPYVSHTEDIIDLSVRTGLSEADTRNLVCRGAGGAGGGTGN